jgi:ABC-type glutathione transport system ATPase component
MRIEVRNKTKNFDSYRSARVKSLFNAERGDTFSLDVDVPVDTDDWQIGVIVGPSGSGKTSIGRELFGGGKIEDLYSGWSKDKPIVDDIAPEGDFNAVTGLLAGVGLGDVPSWLRPFHALSNGQQFRAGLARVLSDGEEDTIIDEFTSVVDRQIAKIGALAFAKAFRRTKGRRVVLLSCHYDILEWVQPDWVLDTSTGEVKKKTTLASGQSSTWKLGRSTELIGDTLKNIII